jgi:hypothetical protein
MLALATCPTTATIRILLSYLRLLAWKLRNLPLNQLKFQTKRVCSDRCVKGHVGEA